MNAIFHSPHILLQPYIKGYCYVNIKISDFEKPLDIHPVGHSMITFVINENKILNQESSDFDYNFRFSYTGHVCRHISFKPLENFIELVLVAFTSTGAFELFGLSQQALINQAWPIGEILPHALEIQSQLEDHANNPYQIMKTLENWLLEQAVKKIKKKPVPIDYACQLIRDHRGTLRIKDLCNKVGISQTVLENNFNERTGLSPKMYSRIVRFLNIHQMIRNSATLDWSDLVYHFDFFDQAHFIKEFKSFFGYSPSKIHLSSQNLAKDIALGL